MRDVVLDKSYLEGASADEIWALCREWRVIMPGALFFEHLTTADPVGRRSFRKFPNTANPVAIVEHVRLLLRYEKRQRRPAIPLYDRRQRTIYSFSESLRQGTLSPTLAQQRSIATWEEQVSGEVQGFRKRVAQTHTWFPEIAQATNRTRPRVIRNYQEQLAQEPRRVRFIYTRIRPRSAPRPAIVNERWAWFRWLQVQLIAALDHIGRYGVGSNLDSANAVRLKNEVIDLQYRIMAVLAGAFATRDPKCQQVFRLLCPRGDLIS